MLFNPLTPNEHYSDCTAPLNSKCCILYIYSRNIGIEYFKVVYNHRAFLLKMQFVSCIIHILYTACSKIKKKSGAKRLINKAVVTSFCSRWIIRVNAK